MEALPSVHLVDDEPGFLVAMSRFLRGSGFAVVTYSSGAELLLRVSAETRGCVVADLSMPGVSGLQLQSLLAERGVTLPIVFLTGHADIPSSVTAMRGGALDFLEKLAPKELIVQAIVRALERDVETHTTHLRLEERRRRLAKLSDREREVLLLVVRGKMNKQIAATLGIHERTVKLHRTGITTKLGVRAVGQLALLASEARLLEVDTRHQFSIGA